MSERHAALRQATVTGVRWISIARVVAETTALASTVSLARLIPPAEFGRAAIALVVVALAAIIGPAGITAPLVQRRSLEAEHVGAAVVLSVASATFFTAVTLVFAQILAPELFGNRTSRLLELAASAWLIGALGAVSQALLQRELRFRWIAAVDSVSVLFGAAAAVVMAVLGFDSVALVMGGLMTLCVATALAVIAAPVRGLRFSRQGLADVGGFALSTSGSGLAFLAYRNVDYAILGARMSPANVGFYWRAYQLGVLYQTKISQIMLRVSFPIYSRSEGLKELRRLRLRIVRTHAIVIVPLLAGFIAVAPLAVPAVFGETWKPAVAPAQIMSIAGIGEALLTGVGPVMFAIGRPGLLLGWNAFELVAYGLLIYLLAPYGLTTVAIGVSAFSIASVIATQTVLLRPLLGLSNRQFAAEAIPGLCVGTSVLAVLLPMRIALEGLGLPAAVVLAFLAVAGLFVYVATLRSAFGDAWSDLMLILHRVTRPALDPPPAGDQVLQAPAGPG